MRHVPTVIAICFAALGVNACSSDSPSGGDGCSTDSDCKGDRICVQNACVATSTGGVGGSSGGTGGKSGSGGTGNQTGSGGTGAVGGSGTGGTGGGESGGTGGAQPCCEGKTCGVDPGCGVSCGTCSDPYVCDPGSYQCEPKCDSADFTWKNNCPTQYNQYDGYCGQNINVYSAIAICSGNSCVWAPSGGSVNWSVPFGQTVNLVAYNCTYGSKWCGNPFFNQTCPLPGIGTVACVCNSGPFPLTNDDCEPLTQNAC